jgi:hypothetical protein
MSQDLRPVLFDPITKLILSQKYPIHKGTELAAGGVQEMRAGAVVFV